MTYQETLDFMYNRLPMYQKVGGVAFKKNLDNTLTLSAAVGNPHLKFRSIHVAGTNGKGSCSHMLSAVFQESGYKTGLYTSPHLKSFTERIRINREEINKSEVVDFIEELKPVIEKISPSFFEITVVMAFYYFAKQNVDIAIIEVGLGGRLDSTNIISPLACLITNIGYDHTDILGETLEEIAFEKAGIIKNNVPVVIGEKHQKTTPVFIAQAEQKNAQITFSEEIISNEKLEPIQVDLLGNHQKKNLRGVLVLMELGVIKKHYSINDQSIEKALSKVTKLTGLKGRWQQLGEYPPVFCDTAHNEEGISAIIEQLFKYQFEKLHIVFGVVKDKKLEKILSLLPQNAIYYFCSPNIPRGLDKNELAEKAKEKGLVGNTFMNVNDAIEKAKNNANPNDFIFIGGSTFVVADIENL